MTNTGRRHSHMSPQMPIVHNDTAPAARTFGSGQ